MKQFLWIFSFLLLPIVGHAQVLINEIAWMGSDTNSNDEWIELYNDGSNDVVLDGWTISARNTSNVETPLIVLKGIIQAHAISLLKSTYGDGENADVSENVLSYAKQLSNDGRMLILKNADLSEIDKVDGSNGWKIDGDVVIGSNVVPRMTAQRTRTGAWVTGLPTPGAENVQEDALATATEEDMSTTTETTTTTTHTQASSSGGGNSKTTAPKKVTPVPETVLSLFITAPRIAYVNQEVTLEVESQGIGKTLMNSLVYTWNFGDTYTAAGKKNTHIFEYPGEYIVIVEGEFAKEKAQARQEIIVLPVSISMSRTEKGDVVIKNNSKQEVDLGDFTLQGTGNFTFPKLTILKAGGALTISAKRINVQRENSVALYDVLRTLVVRDGGILPVENILALKNPTKQRSVTATSEMVIKNKVSGVGTETTISPTSTETPEIKKEETNIIQIGKLATNDNPTSQGFFKKIVSRVFGFFGM